MTHFNGKIVNSYSRITRPSIGERGGAFELSTLSFLFHHLYWSPYP